jgi:hypothetical protein
VPGGIGADLRMRGKIAGSPLEDGSGHVRVREALRVRALNEWVDVEQTVGELADRLDLLRGSKRQGRSNC